MIDFFEKFTALSSSAYCRYYHLVINRFRCCISLYFQDCKQKSNFYARFCRWNYDCCKFWSLLQPSIDYGTNGHLPAWLPAAIGFILGGVFIRGLDAVIPHIHQKSVIKVNIERALKLL